MPGTVLNDLHILSYCCARHHEEKGMENLNQFLNITQLLSDGVSEFEPRLLGGVYMWGKRYIVHLMQEKEKMNWLCLEETEALAFDLDILAQPGGF